MDSFDVEVKQEINNEDIELKEIKSVDEVRVKLLPHLCEFVSLFPSEN